jgi:CNT family concentrative nucleoside transporter
LLAEEFLTNWMHKVYHKEDCEFKVIVIMDVLIPLIGICVLLLVGALSSSNWRSISLRTVCLAFLLQVSLGGLMIYLPAGREALALVSSLISNLLSFSKSGAKFVFGDLGDADLGFFFAFQVLPIVIFFASLISVLYHLKIMQFVIRMLGGFLEKVLKTSKVESTAAAANLFVGLTEAPLTIKPYIQAMTKSEFFSLMTVGLATVAGSVLAGYAALGISLDYLVAASFMSAPGALLMAKIIEPEIQTGEKLQDLHIKVSYEKHQNIIEAAASGAIQGLKLALAIGAMLVAFIGLIALINGMLIGFGDFLSIDNLTIDLILGYLFQPVAFVLGVPWQESGLVGGLIGKKIVFNEFVAFISLSEIQNQMSQKALVISTFALCGFANFGSIAVLLGGLGVLVPKRRPEIAKYGIKAMYAATLSNLMSAAIVSVFFSLI